MTQPSTEKQSKFYKHKTQPMHYYVLGDPQNPETRTKVYRPTPMGPLRHSTVLAHWLVTLTLVHPGASFADKSQMELWWVAVREQGSLRWYYPWEAVEAGIVKVSVDRVLPVETISETGEPC